MSALERLAAVLFCFVLWGCPELCGAQVERARVPAGQMMPLACADREEVPADAAYPCQLVAEQPSGDAVIYVDEPDLVTALAAVASVTSAAWIASRWIR